MKSEEEGGTAPRTLCLPGSGQVVATAAVLLAVGALGFLVWALASPGQLAWLTSIECPGRRPYSLDGISGDACLGCAYPEGSR